MIFLYSIISLMVAYLAYDRFWGGTKTGYVIILDVYNQFSMKKELQKKYESSHSARKKIVDSLAMAVRMLAQKIQAEKVRDTSDIRIFNEKRMEYFERKHMIAQDDSAQMKQYDESILNQINQYVKDYAKENHYKYIFGNGGNGDLMAADESENITAAVTQYINERYEGKK